MTKKCRGFTLIELLTVIGIIGILAAMLFTTIFRAKQKSLGIGCLNNQRQLTLAWHLYAGDNNDSVTGNLGRGVSRNWFYTNQTWVSGWLSINSTANDNERVDFILNAQLGPYTRTWKIYKCPGDTTTMKGQPRLRSYSMNGYFGVPWDGICTPNFQRFSKLSTRTSQLILFVEEREDNINDGFFFINMNTNNPIVGDWPSARHNQRGSVSMIDGSTRIQKWRDARTIPPLLGKPLEYASVLSPDNLDLQWLSNHGTYPE